MVELGFVFSIFQSHDCNIPEFGNSWGADTVMENSILCVSYF